MVDGPGEVERTPARAVMRLLVLGQRGDARRHLRRDLLLVGRRTRRAYGLAQRVGGADEQERGRRITLERGKEADVLEQERERQLSS